MDDGDPQQYHPERMLAEQVQVDMTSASVYSGLSTSLVQSMSCITPISQRPMPCIRARVAEALPRKGDNCKDPGGVSSLERTVDAEQNKTKQNKCLQPSYS